MKRALFLALFAAAVFGGWYYASPLYALHQLREAARAGDAADIERRVDFMALRASLTSELQGELNGRGSSILERVGARLAGVAAGPVVDTLVTPEGVARLVREGRVGPVMIAPMREGGSPAAGPDLHIERGSLDTFRASDAANPDGPAMIFARDGLGWILVGVDL